MFAAVCVMSVQTSPVNKTSGKLYLIKEIKSSLGFSNISPLKINSWSFLSVLKISIVSLF